jgi:hypothetical protein
LFLFVCPLYETTQALFSHSCGRIGRIFAAVIRTHYVQLPEVQ